MQNPHKYLSDIDEQAEDMFSRLVKQMAERECVTEKLKAENQMEWVGRMNNIRNREKEIVFANFINNEKGGEYLSRRMLAVF